MKGFALFVTDPPVASHMLKVIRDEVGGGAVQLRRMWERQIMQWRIDFPRQNRQWTEQLMSTLLYHAGDTLLWWDGGANGDIRNPIFIGYGNGARTDWFLPYRYVYAPSLVLYGDGDMISTWELTEETGMLRIIPAPDNDVQLTAKFKCRFKAFFATEDDSLYEQVDQFKSYSDRNLTIREFPY